MFSADNLFSYPYWEIPFMLHTNAYDKQFGTVIIHNNKPIAFFSIIIRKSQHNYITTKRELIAIF